MIISKASILKESREIVAREGLNALSIRKLAKQCNVAVGSIYNYFSSKDELMISTIESVWEDIFRIDDSDENYDNFLTYLGDIFNHLSVGIEKYPNFFTIHSLSFKSQSISKAKDSMSTYLDKLRDNMIEILDRDSDIKANAFDDEFTKDDLVRFILSTSLCFIVEKNYDQNLLLKIIKKIIY
ncbi:TetR/AcrR family transcriptional regulator [uncultured Anaerococcus sp.]|uniref:TetR/AcrR family transcriptional regulator n=1 Tax=uncultured Anaerococcus sp. TaxID=293428 RepID=UPI00288B9476|nr:TetR/AcrR family transcriptional regulator [uncultured Anaerococcus sp.]